MPDHRKKDPAKLIGNAEIPRFGQQLRDLAVRYDRMAVAVEKKPVNRATAEHTRHVLHLMLPYLLDTLRDLETGRIGYERWVTDQRTATLVL